MTRRGQRGFTLIEIGVVLALVVLLFGIAIPTLNSLSGANARASVSKLAANIRATRGQAAVSGATCRVVFDLEEQQYWVECSEGSFQVAFERELNGERRFDEEDEELEPEDLERLSDQERAKYELRRKTAFAARVILEPQALDGVVIDSVWTQHQEEPYSKGRAQLYFFPSGLGERAVVHLRDDDAWFSLHVSPLSGKVEVFGEKKDLPDVRWEDT